MGVTREGGWFWRVELLGFEWDGCFISTFELYS
jgi:hypothetical protein